MKLGVFGGTFNPIHLGHLYLARCARTLFGLEQVYFVVATSPPHKPLENLVPFIHRYAMVGLATATTPSFIPSLVELDPPASAFSLHTMEKFALDNEGRSADLYFIAGGDSLSEVPGWHRGEELLGSYNFIFVARPGVAHRNAGEHFPAGIHERIIDLRKTPPRRLAARIREETTCRESRIFIIEAGAPDISSSMIRGLVDAGRPIDQLVPASVNQYIHKLHLYGER